MPSNSIFKALYATLIKYKSNYSTCKHENLLNFLYMYKYVEKLGFKTIVEIQVTN